MTSAVSPGGEVGIQRVHEVGQTIGSIDTGVPVDYRVGLATGSDRRKNSVQLAWD
ncbi:hypothetical protein [Haloarcula sp. JP-L23]|uniref:hypothetical protein n=1 Tax=Haloarcula sp. JP-L23 TaxID=2716717 RepID=UPI00140EDC3C|nr:hypothetical protein G9465_22215 [Haloarcula sp. JP-L23]